MTKLTKETLRADLQAFAQKLGKTPTRTEMNEAGPHSSTPYYTRWGSWNAALEAAGLGTNHENGISEDRLVEELQRLDSELERLPRFDDMEEEGEYSGHTYLRTFGSWGEAKAAAGLSTERRTSRRIERAELIEGMQELAEELGKAPTQVEMKEEGRFSHRPYYREWDSWSEATRAAGLDPNNENNISEGLLIQAIQELADELGHTPTRFEMDEQGRYSSDPYLRAFGSWTNAWQAAGLDYRKWNPSRTSEKELLEAMCGLAEELEKVPTREEMNELGNYSYEPFRRAFGTWSSAVEAAGFEPYRADDTDGEYLYYGASWPSQRHRALLRDQYRCQHSTCKITDSDHREQYGCSLHVHHLVKRRRFECPESANKLDNLITLCQEHHVMWESKSRVKGDGGMEDTM